MRQITLLRHAKSSWDDTALSDRERPLNPKGRDQLPLIESYVRRHEIRPAMILCSPAVRTRQTLNALVPLFDGLPTVFDERIYEGSWQGLLALLTALPDEAGSVLLVGHNPGLHTLATRLIHPAPHDRDFERLRDKLPTGSLAVLDAEAPRWADLAPETCRLSAFFRPAAA